MDYHDFAFVNDPDMLAIRLIAAYTAIAFIVMAVLLTCTAFLGLGPGLVLGVFLILVLWTAFKILTWWQCGHMVTIDEMVDGDHETPAEQQKTQQEKRFRFKRLR